MTLCHMVVPFLQNRTDYVSDGFNGHGIEYLLFSLHQTTLRRGLHKDVHSRKQGYPGVLRPLELDGQMQTMPYWICSKEYKDLFMTRRTEMPSYFIDLPRMAKINKRRSRPVYASYLIAASCVPWNGYYFSATGLEYQDINNLGLTPAIQALAAETHDRPRYAKTKGNQKEGRGWGSPSSS